MVRSHHQNLGKILELTIRDIQESGGSLGSPDNPVKILDLTGEAIIHNNKYHTRKIPEIFDNLAVSYELVFNNYQLSRLRDYHELFSDVESVAYMVSIPSQLSTPPAVNVSDNVSVCSSLKLPSHLPWDKVPEFFPFLFEGLSSKFNHKDLSDRSSLNDYFDLVLLQKADDDYHSFEDYLKSASDLTKPSGELFIQHFSDENYFFSTINSSLEKNGFSLRELIQIKNPSESSKNWKNIIIYEKK